MGKRKESLTRKRLKELFFYNRETGVFTRKIARGNQAAGTTPGTINHPTGRKYMMVDGKTYFSYRLAWLYLYGAFPENEIDHKDCDNGNDSALNLREATRTVNAQNKKNVQKNNILGVAGVNQRENGTYRARIRVDGKLLNLGTFGSVGEASTAYKNAKIEFHGGYLP